MGDFVTLQEEHVPEGNIAMEQLGGVHDSETPGGPVPLPLPLPPCFEFKQITINKEEIKKRTIGIIKRKVPIVEWLPKYNLKNIKGDLVAGITVGVMLIPQAMAYALVAGLPPIYGLYSSIVPLIIFGLFTTSKHLSVGPFAIISLLVGDAVAQYLGDEKSNVEKYVSVTILLTFMCGIIKLVFGILRFGFLVNFLSDPVRSGFNSASAIIIGVSQLRHLFGVPVPSEDFAWMTLFEIAKEIPHTNGWSFLIGVVGIAMLVAMKKISKKYKITIPGALIVVALGTLISWAAKLEQNAHIIVVGSVPSGFPPIRNPFGAVDHFWDAVVQLSSSALIIVVVTFISSMAISTKFAEQFHYKVNANQELLAMGLADTVGSLFSAYPLAASLSRTAVNVQSGARTPLAGILSTILVIVTLLFLAPVVYFIPRALLASIVLVAVVDIIEYNKVRELWSVHKKDTVLLLLAFFSTLFIGILQGLLIGIGASLALILYRSAYPPVAELGRLMGSTTYINCKRFPQSVTVPGLVIVRFDGSLYFSNVEHVRKRLRTYILKNTNCSPDDAIRWVVLDCSSMIDIDSTAIRGLKESVLELRQNNIQLIFTCLKGPIRDAIKRCGVVSLAGPDHFFWSVHDAVKNYYYVVLNTIPPSIEEEQKLQHGQNIQSPESFDPSKKDPGGSCKGYAQPQTKNENDYTSSSEYNSSTGDFDSTNSVNSNNNNNNNNNNSSAVVVVDNEFSPFVFDTQESVDNAHTPLLASIALPKLNLKLPTL